MIFIRNIIIILLLTTSYFASIHVHAIKLDQSIECTPYRNGIINKDFFQSNRAPNKTITYYSKNQYFEIPTNLEIITCSNGSSYIYLANGGSKNIDFLIYGDDIDNLKPIKVNKTDIDEPHDFTTSNTSIYAIESDFFTSPENMIYIYDLNFNYKSTFKLDYTPSNLFYDTETNLLYVNNGNTGGLGGFFIYDSNLNLVDSFYLGFIGCDTMVKYKDDIFYCVDYKNGIYVIQNKTIVFAYDNLCPEYTFYAGLYVDSTNDMLIIGCSHNAFSTSLSLYHLNGTSIGQTIEIDNGGIMGLKIDQQGRMWISYEGNGDNLGGIWIFY